MSGIKTLTKEQQAFLVECQTQFSGRYTDSDPEFKRKLESDIPTPPIIENWTRIRQHGNYNRNNYRRNYQRNENHRNDGHNDSYNQRDRGSYNRKRQWSDE